MQSKLSNYDGLLYQLQIAGEIDRLLRNDDAPSGSASCGRVALVKVWTNPNRPATRVSFSYLSWKDTVRTGSALPDDILKLHRICNG